MDNQILKQLIEDKGVTLYDTEVVTEGDQKIFRVYIASKEGISMDKCTEITRIISPILDLEPPVSGEYTLEVSSPGIERKLSKLEHFQGSIGELAKIKRTNGEKYQGQIVKVENETVTILDHALEKEVQIPLSEINKARTYFEW